MKAMEDMSCLAEGLVVPADFSKTGLNLNEMIVGSTGCGKSVSNAYSRLMHTTCSSVVVPVAKRKIRDMYAEVFRKRGYKVIDLDFVHPEMCENGYDPFDYLRTDEDILNLAENIICSTPTDDMTKKDDPYWSDSAANVLAAEIGLLMINAKAGGKKPTLADLFTLHRSIVPSATEDCFATNIDAFFDRAGELQPECQAIQLWRSIRGNARKTANCILSFVSTAINKLATEGIRALAEKKEKISFGRLKKEKTAVFITTSPMNRILQSYLNILYGNMFKELFEQTEDMENDGTGIPVHVICDDFACSGTIRDFENYISVFRAAGISVTLLLQSETQLSDMYGRNAATTIINNCDTYVYMGGMDIDTCRNIAQRWNKPLSTVMNMPLEQVVVFRRGSVPFVSRRYQTFSDPLYKELFEERETPPKNFSKKIKKTEGENAR